jgi:hypothetical protein
VAITDLTAAQIRKLNSMNPAAQSAKLGSVIQDLIDNYGTDLDGTEDGKAGADDIGMTGINPFSETTVQSFLEALVARIIAETDSASGADLVAITPIAQLGAADTVQEALEAAVAALISTTNDTSGADLVGATAISGWSGATVQAILESAKTAVDAKKERVGFGSVIKAGNVTASISSTVCAIAVAAGKITEAGLHLVTAGADGTDPLSYELDVLINGTTIFSTKPKLNYYTGAVAGANANTFVAGTGITVGVINAAANTVAIGNRVTYTLTRTATTPDTEAADAFMQGEIEYTVV